ncbi:Rieske 2Fe-2S domain-containing protein [Halomonas campisalis]|uniref:Rieske 2Fe-2S domain-containing protein n=1 Tax=Billgrantia campisalis TaxID=74661 RepID=A0ABS9P6R2_9GAMM|nr:Rieske 2Fe-2S domain-containing protein [Halomonas campisalis]MCG6657471.1 Rieske 2Fe-2S domain-containing protein [Halomonas campisalis]MDR5863183.1 Rieske 2Fe-2S domain-containing protein [Halomonas campisalis]
MVPAWQRYRSAPALGTRLIQAADLPPGSTRCLYVEGENGHFPLLLVAVDDGPRAYVNACPHQYLPLDQRGKRILSQDGEQLRCTNHAATFSARTGEGLSGHGEGCALDPVPLSVDDDGWLMIGSSV